MEKTKIINICDRIVLFSIYATVFFLPISNALIETFSIMAIVFYAIKKILQYRDVQISPVGFAVLVYFIICGFSIFISSNPEISLNAFIGKVAQNILFFFVVAETLNTERRVKNLLYILFFSASVVGVDGIYQHFTHKDFIRHRPYYDIPRIHASFANSNGLACYLQIVSFFVLVSLFIKLRFKLFKILFAALFVLLVICLVLTSSRGGLYAFISGILFMGIWIRAIMISFLALGIIIVSLSYFSWFKQRPDGFFAFLGGGDTDRRQMWYAARMMFKSSPWVGVGLGTFMFNFRKFTDGVYPQGVPYAHNCYLQIADETGIIGLAVFLSILVLFFWSGIKRINSGQKTFFWYILLASLAAVFGYCVQMAVDVIFYSLDLGILFWLLLGLGVAAMERVKLEGVK